MPEVYEGQREPWFPEPQDAIELNQAAHVAYGQPTWGGVLKPNELESAVNAAKQHYYYGPEEDEAERLAQAGGKMAWRIAGNQVFGDGNKRTALWLTRHFLDQNGLGHLSPLDYDDTEFADHLIGQDKYGENMTPEQLPAERARLEQNFQDMWRRRYAMGGPDPQYQQQYPEGTYLAPGQDQGRQASASGWFAPSFAIPSDTRASLHQYAQSLPWPEGSKLNDPDKYHVTGTYAPEGYGDPRLSQWIDSQAGITHPASVSGLESFADSPSPKGVPVVLRLNGDSLHQHGEQLMNEAEQQGLAVSRFPGGYKPHITLGYSPTPIEAPAPRMNMQVGPLFDLHRHYDALKQRQANTSEHKLWFKPRPGVWGRGLVHVPTQTVHTWPEEEGTHAQMAQLYGGILNTEPFAISPEGTVHASGGLNLDRYADLIHEATGFRVGPNQNRLVDEGSETPGWGGQDKQSNILDPIHQSLDPAVWDQPDSSQPKLRADHQKWITDRIFKVLDDHGYDNPAKWLTLILTGSLTTYQYSDDSDCDVSLFVNSEAFPEWSRAEMIGIMISEVDGAKLPGTTHPMQDFVVSRKLSPTDLYKPGLRSGYIVYGDGEGTWVVPPERSRVHDVEKEENEAYTIALENADKMEKLLRYEPDKAVMFAHQVHRRRLRDQTVGKGDFSPSNITYKMLANRGLLDRINELAGTHYGGHEELS